MKSVVSLLVLLATVYLISQSRKWGKATFYVLATMLLTFVIGLGIGQAFPTMNTEAVGSGTIDVMFLVGLLTALIHFRKSRDSK